MPDSGWVAVAISLLGSGAIAVGSYFVTRDRVARLTSDLAEKVDRREFEQAMKAVAELHRDLREIRDLLSTFLTKVQP